MYIQDGYFSIHFSWLPAMIAAGAVAYLVLSMAILRRRRRLSVLRLLRQCPDGVHGREIGKICRLSMPHVVLGALEDKGYIMYTIESAEGRDLPTRMYSLTTVGEQYLDQHD